MVFSVTRRKSSDSSHRNDTRHQSYADRTSTIKMSMIDLLQSFNGYSYNEVESLMRDLQLNQKDKTDTVNAHTQKGIEFLERVGTYAKERASIEEEYASKLRQLVKKSIGKKKDDEEALKTFTYMQAFVCLLREVDSYAAQHEVISEKLRNEVLPFVAMRANQHRANRKQCNSDLQAIHNNLNNSLDHLVKQQRSYVKSFKEAEAAHLKYTKADNNLELSRLDLEKARNNAKNKSEMSELAKQQYAVALQGANKAQKEHYENFLPQILEKMREVDSERIRDTKAAMDQCICAEVDVRPIVVRCQEDMKRAVEMINVDRDTTVVVDMFKTGYKFPPEQVFEDLGRPDQTFKGSTDQIDSTIKRGGLKNGKSVLRKPSMHNKIFGGGSDKKAEANGDYGHLPPQQRVRRLQAKIGELEKQKEKCQHSFDGIHKMQQVYKDNPKLGNAADCESQLNQYSREMEVLGQHIQKLRGILEEAHSQNNLPLGGADTPPSTRSVSSAGSVAPPPRPQPPPNGANHRSSYSEESVTSSEGGTGSSRATAVRDEVYEECALPALGTATVQFPFEDYDGSMKGLNSMVWDPIDTISSSMRMMEGGPIYLQPRYNVYYLPTTNVSLKHPCGGTEGTMKITEGEDLLLVEKDEGDGWTRVRRLDNPMEGFVPTSYLKCKWYSKEES